MVTLIEEIVFSGLPEMVWGPTFQVFDCVEHLIMTNAIWNEVCRKPSVVAGVYGSL
jgi:hypothetical protein